MNTHSRIDRCDRSRRQLAVAITVIVGLLTAALVAGMIYLYYKTTRF